MVFHVARRVAWSSFRASQAGARTAFANAGAVARRAMSSGAHGSESKSSDMPWIIGSAAVTGPALLYLLSPASRKPAAEHVHATHDAKEPNAKASTEPPAKEAPTEPSANEKPSEEEKALLLTDDEGTKASEEEVKASIEQATNADSPSDAKAAEAKETSAEPTSSVQTTSEESHVEEQEKPGSKKEGTLQSAEDEGPTAVGDARQAAKDQKLPKQAAQGK